MWPNGEIFQVLFTLAFTSFCHTFDGTMGSKLQRHHCLLPPHVAEVFTVFFLCAVCPGGGRVDVSRFFGLALRLYALTVVGNGIP